MKFEADILKPPTHRDILPQFTSVTHTHKTRLAAFKEGKELLAYTLNDKIFKLFRSILREALQRQYPQIEVVAHHVCSLYCVFLRFSLFLFDDTHVIAL